MSATGRLVLGAVARTLDFAGDWLAPPSCAACDAPCRPKTAFCPACAATVEPAEPGTPFCAFAYGGAIRTAVVRLKYEGRTDLGRPLGFMLQRAAAGAGLSSDIVVPVPLHPTRLAERGFNQASLLAREVARTCGTFSVALRRREARRRQAALGREDRLANLEGAFMADAGVRGRRIILVDDVCTTGATLRACEHALLAAGARSVEPIALLRATA